MKTNAATFLIPGRVIPKKNSRPIWRDAKTGKPRLGKSKLLQAYEARAILELRKQWAGRKPYTAQLHVESHAYFSTRRNEPDLLGWQETVWDCLQAAGIIKNDKLIESSDKSRKHYAPGEPDHVTVAVSPYET